MDSEKSEGCWQCAGTGLLPIAFVPGSDLVITMKCPYCNPDRKDLVNEATHQIRQALSQSDGDI